MAADEFMCIGDTVCLFSEDVYGFVISTQSGDAQSYIAVKPKENRVTPNIPDPQLFSFRVISANRYKLQKNYRKLQEKFEHDKDNLHLRAQLIQIEKDAEAEVADNASEQKRKRGKRLHYGQVVQIQHIFTSKFIHVSTRNTSLTESSNMQVFLGANNDNTALFKILPRYKVKADGDLIQLEDQVVFASVKSPGQFLNVSRKTYGGLAPVYSDSHELNLSVRSGGFTIYRRYKPGDDDEPLLMAGEIVRMFHTETEAYLACEGCFDEAVLEDVHLRVRAIDQNKPKTLQLPSSAINYWQFEDQESVIKGDVIKWEQQIRIKHMTTRKYLKVDGTKKISLTSEHRDPNTVFRFFPVIKEREEIADFSYCRIQHVVTHTWLHCSNDVYERQSGSGDKSGGMGGLQWSQAPLRKLSVIDEMQYDDAFTIQTVDSELRGTYNYVAGMVLFLQKLVTEKKSGKHLNALWTQRICTSLKEMADFMVQNGEPVKERQKLLRNLRVVELLVELLRIPIRGSPDQAYLSKVFMEAYNVLAAYLLGDSRKNELYIAKHVDFFRSQTIIEGEVGLRVAQMVMELVKDNRKIVDRIPSTYVEETVELLNTNKNYRYLDMLSVLCVCDGMSITDNQKHVADIWLKANKNAIYHTELGQAIELQPGKLYLSTDDRKSWRLLSDFLKEALNKGPPAATVGARARRNQRRKGLSDEEQQRLNKESVDFFVHQLDLFGKLCQGHNTYCIDVITLQLNYITWEELMLCVADEELPEEIRAKYIELMIYLFIDVGDASGAAERVQLTYTYDDIENTSQKTKMSPENKKRIPPLKAWLEKFLGKHGNMVASQVGVNMMLEQVLRLVYYLVKYGFYGSSKEEVTRIMEPLLSLLDGRNDTPFPIFKSSQFSKLVHEYQTTDRFKESVETKAIVEAKFQATEVLDLFFNFRFNARLSRFIEEFKYVYSRSNQQLSHPPELFPLLQEDFDYVKHPQIRHAALRKLEEIFEESAFFKAAKNVDIVDVLMDLAKYEYPDLIRASMRLLNRYFSAYDFLFKRAVTAQVLTTSMSTNVFKTLERDLPKLRRLASSKMTPEQTETMAEILDRFTEFCTLPNDPSERHPMNQSILYNQGVVNELFDLVSQEVDVKMLDKYSGLRAVFGKAFILMKAMAKQNPVVQTHVFDRMNTLLDIKGSESELGEALAEVFTNNKGICMKVTPSHIYKVTGLVATNLNSAPEFLDLLNALVKIEELDLPLKRNQGYVMQYFMQYRSSIAYTLEKSIEEQKRMLMSKDGDKDVDFTLSLVDLLATCAEGENRLIESINQTIYQIMDLVDILKDPGIFESRKRPYARFLTWVYLNTAGGLIESGAGDFPHDPEAWKYFQTIEKTLQKLTEFSMSNKKPAKNMIATKMSARRSASADKEQAELQGCFHYIFEGVMPMLQAFFRNHYIADDDEHITEQETINSLTKSMKDFVDVVGRQVTNTSYYKCMVSTMTTLLPLSDLPRKVVDDFNSKFGDGAISSGDNRGESRKKYDTYYGAEEQLNASLNTYAINYSVLYGGENTVLAQLDYDVDNEYSEIGGDEDLPLGREFQEHLRLFMTNSTNYDEQYYNARHLVDQLKISSKIVPANEKSRLEQETLDVKCLQLIRAFIHNEIVKLPRDYDDDVQLSDKILESIFQVQTALNKHGVMIHVMAMLGRQSDDIIRETLGVLVNLLSFGNRDVQQSLIDYFLGTREEMFFFAVKDRMDMSAIAIKEKRALMSQNQARIDETLLQIKEMQQAVKEGKFSKDQLAQTHLGSMLVSASRLSLQGGKRIRTGGPGGSKMALRAEAFGNTDKLKKQLRAGGSQAQLRGSQQQLDMAHTNNHVAAPNHVIVHTGDDSAATSKNRVAPVAGEDLGVDEGTMEEVARNAVMDAEDMEFHDDGYVTLVLRMLANTCDGQNELLQNYMRQQPDNIKSVNLVAETAQFLSLTYSSINKSNIELVIQIFDTLVELTSGNILNQHVVYDGKVTDYINFLLRSNTALRKCNLSEEYSLKMSIVTLLIALMEMNVKRPKETVLNAEELKEKKFGVAKDVAAALDAESIRNIVVECYERVHLPKNDPKKLDAEMEEFIEDVGYKYFQLLLRMSDLYPEMPDLAELFPSETRNGEILYDYTNGTSTVEVILHDEIQKVYFRIRDKSVLREEVKDSFNYNVDRTSPSNKIRDFMEWSKEIIADINYQREVLSNPIGFFFVRGWKAFNLLTIFLSLVIAVIILVDWDEEPGEHDNPVPVRSGWCVLATLVCGIIHNVLSFFVLISYFLSDHPKFPTLRESFVFWKDVLYLRSDDDEDADSSVLRKHFFSFSTIYYLVFFAMSILGTVYYGYFFAFHLLHIATQNQLLARVIMAVTQNGLSLLWVAIYSLAFFYIYALISFAGYRAYYTEASGLYCTTISECMVTVIHDGLISGIGYVRISDNINERPFRMYIIKAIFDISFYIIISTIGLNIIFGIIVDTFSELRDNKWHIDNDMTTACFICSQNAYDFEHYGKGFDHHVKHEHNQWAYLFYFIYLDSTKENDLSAIELKINNMVKDKENEFFPLNRSLTLQNAEVDENDAKLETLLENVEYLVVKWKEEQLLKEREQERKKQMEWEQKYRKSAAKE